MCRWTAACCSTCRKNALRWVWPIFPLHQNHQSCCLSLPSRHTNHATVLCPASMVLRLSILEFFMNLGCFHQVMTVALHVSYVDTGKHHCLCDCKFKAGNNHVCALTGDHAHTAGGVFTAAAAERGCQPHGSTAGLASPRSGRAHMQVLLPTKRLRCVAQGEPASDVLRHR